MTNHEQNFLGSAQTPMYTDAEMTDASGMPLPSLRVLQAAGAIQSEKKPKEHGGFRRMWPATQVLKAAIGSSLGEHFSWNVRLVAAVLARGHRGLFEKVIQLSIAASERREVLVPFNNIMVSEQLDIFVDLIDRKFIFLRIPVEFVSLIGYPIPNILFGIVNKDNFQYLTSAAVSVEGQKMVWEMFGKEKGSKIINLHKLVNAARTNPMSITSVNISMQIRAAWRRLHGLETTFVTNIIESRVKFHDSSS